MSKELIAATQRELGDWPGATMTQEPNGKHGKLVLHYNDQSRLVIMALTPSDSRAIPNHLGIVRRELRSMGAQKAKIIVGKPKEERPHKPMQPATAKPMKELETIMSEAPKAPVNAGQKINRILASVADLRYGEMLEFAALLSQAAIETKLQRNRPHDWARMFQMLAEGADKA